MGTLQGLVRFDGNRFKVFDRDNTHLLTDNVINALHEDRRGVLWLGTAEGGLSCIRKGKFTTYPPDMYPGLKDIASIFQSRDGALWIGTMLNGLTRFKDGLFTTYSEQHGLPKAKIRAFYQDREGTLHIATSSGLFVQSSPANFVPYGKSKPPFNKYMISLCQRKNGELWFGCGDGLYSVKDELVKHFGLDDGLPSQVIKFVFEDKDRNLWAGTDGGGLLRVRNGEVEIFSTSHGLACDYVYSIFQCKEGNLWLGTLHGGLHRLKDSFVTNYTIREGLNHNNVQCVAQDRKGRIWIGTRGGGVNRLEDGRVTFSLTTKNGLLSNSVNSIKEDRGSNIWIASDSGLNRFSQGKMSAFTTKNGLSNHRVSDLVEDKDGTIWIVTSGRTHHYENGTLSEFKLEGESAQARIQLICKDHDGGMWFALNNGNVVNWKDGEIKTRLLRRLLLSEFFESLYVDREGVLYIGTRAGMIRVEQGKITGILTRNGLLDASVREILEDRRGYLWLAGRTGISYVHKNQLRDFAGGKIIKIKPRLIDEQDGLVSPWFEKGFETSDGKFWFTSAEGLSMFDPHNVKAETLVFPVIIEELLVNEKKADIGEQPLILPPGKKRLEFHYTAPNFIKTQKMRFKLKLDGYDSGWIDNGNSRSTTYTGLSPGHYTLNLKACSGDGIWSPESATFSFYIQPYFYQTIWFYIFVALLILISFFSFYRFRIRQLKHRQKELSEQVAIRTRQLAEQSEKLKEMDKIKSHFFANISHEFRTPLTLIMAPLEQWLAENPDKKRKKILSLMFNNSRRLLGLINQLLELSKFDSGKVKLHATPYNIVYFTRGIMASFDAVAMQKKLDFSLESEEENITLYFDAEKLEKVIANLLSNAVKFTPPGGNVLTSIKLLAADALFPCGAVELSFSDTGPGIPKNQLEAIFDRFSQADYTYEHHHKGSGIGLAIAREIIELHRGIIKVFNKEEDSAGATFVIHLPMGHKHLEPDQIVAAHQPPMTENSSPGNQVPEVPEVPEIRDSEFEAEQDEEIQNNNKQREVISGASREKKDIILVVEDSAGMREYIKNSLEPLYSVAEAADGTEGLHSARKIVPDLIISDVMMPEMNGFELCKALKQEVITSHIPVVLLTAKAAETDMIDGLETGADDYITKPFNTRILLTRVKNLIDLRRRLQESIQRSMALQPSEINVSSIDQEFLKELKAIIEKKLSEMDFNVDALANALYISRPTLNRKIRAITGESTNQFIQSYRLMRAAQLLKANTGNVTEVAFQVGFSNSSYFARRFKEKFHRQPLAYRDSESSAASND